MGNTLSVRTCINDRKYSYPFGCKLVVGNVQQKLGIACGHVDAHAWPTENNGLINVSLTRGVQFRFVMFGLKIAHPRGPDRDSGKACQGAICQLRYH